MRTRNAKLQLRESNSSRMTIGSNLLFIVGTCITLAALVYMIVNLDKADSIITMWIFLLAVGILLMFLGLSPFIRSFQNKTIGKRYGFR
jgi:Na+/melibiose symporter-like transporter